MHAALPTDRSPGDDPPLYLMRRDFVQGICAGAAEILSLMLVAVTWKRHREYSSMALWMGWFWCMPAVVDAVIIFCRSCDLMDPHKAISGWDTFYEYLNDPFRRFGFWGTALSGLLLAYFLSRKQTG